MQFAVVISEPVCCERCMWRSVTVHPSHSESVTSPLEVTLSDITGPPMPLAERIFTKYISVVNDKLVSSHTYQSLE
jgi:hypothetical protein